MHWFATTTWRCPFKKNANTAPPPRPLPCIHPPPNDARLCLSPATRVVAALRLRGELEAAGARLEGALKELEESRARVLDRAGEEAALREEADGLRVRVDELQGKQGRRQGMGGR